MLQAYEGDVDKLGNAEKFFHALMQLKEYKLRIEMMMLKGDFNSQLGAIRPNIQTLNTVCRKLMDNESLKVFLRFVLHAGNFINGVSNNVVIKYFEGKITLRFLFIFTIIIINKFKQTFTMI